MATDETTSRTTDVSPATPRLPTAAEQRAREHAGTTDTDVLARDIAQTRAELSVTIDAIVDRVSPKKVVERSKQQAREGVQDATEIVKGHATTAASLVRQKALTASEVVQSKVAELKDKASGAAGSTPSRSPLTPATSVSLASATPVSSPDAGPVSSAPAATSASTSAPGSAPASASTSMSASPLPAGTVSIDAGELPPPEPAATTGALADAADAGRPGVEPPGADLPSHRPVGGPTAVPPVYAGAGAAALLAVLLLLLRRRSVRRRSHVRHR